MKLTTPFKYNIGDWWEERISPTTTLRAQVISIVELAPGRYEKSSYILGPFELTENLDIQDED